MSRSRLFLAVQLAPKVVEATVQLQRKLAESEAQVKWVSREMLHITLVFLGDIDDRDQHTICKAAAKSLKRETPLNVSLGGVGAFPSLRRPKILWAGLETGEEAVIRVQKKLSDALEETGLYRPEDRPYVPHVTLGRCSDEEAGNVLVDVLPDYQEWFGGETRVDAVGLYSSEFKRGEAVYTLLGKMSLGELE